MRLLITTLAEYQTVFWQDVGLELRRTGHDPAFISFDDRSTEMLNDAGFRVYTADRSAVSSAEAEAILERFGVTDLNHWLSHERFAFNATDSDVLTRRLASYLLASDAALAAEGDTVMVQELGGFLSVIAGFFASHSRNVPNWFLEPSFFRGNLFFLCNSFSAVVVDEARPAIDEKLDAYLASTLASGAIVIPQKDRHQYTSARRKIVNWRNARRLVSKLIDKHILGKSQEFGHIGSHVATHARMLMNSRRLQSYYTPLNDAEPFVYYPLHVPGDMALTLRSPTYLDQTALVDYLCRSVPRTHRVAIKEHPAMVGAFDAGALIKLKKRYDHLVILPPTENNYAVMRAADLIVTVNSKSGAEAGLLGKPVIVLGDAFYRKAPFSYPIDRLQDLPSTIKKVLSAAPLDPGAARTFFARAWSLSYPGELYVATPENVEVFTQSMLKALS